MITRRSINVPVSITYFSIIQYILTTFVITSLLSFVQLQRLQGVEVVAGESVEAVVRKTWV